MSESPTPPTPAPAASSASPEPAPRRAGPARGKPRRERHPLLPELARMHPKVFGPKPLPFKLGIFEDLLARHPEIDRVQLKQALSQHARSTPYLESVASGERRHDLDGSAVEDVAPEHRQHAIMEVFRRRQLRMAGKDLRPWLLERLAGAIGDSGLDRDAYLERVRTSDPDALQAIHDAFALRGERNAKHEAVRRAFEASGRSVAEFAQMYGLDVSAVEQAIGTAR